MKISEKQVLKMINMLTAYSAECHMRGNEDLSRDILKFLGEISEQQSEELKEIE